MGSIRRAGGVPALVGTLFLALAIAPSGQSRPARTVSPTALRPHAVKLLINGKRWPLETLTGPDKYIGIPAGKLRVEARWMTDARGTGHYVTISTGATLGRTLVRCSRGTSCVVPTKVSVRPNQELTLTVKVVKTSSSRTVAGFRACLNGR